MADSLKHCDEPCVTYRAGGFLLVLGSIGLSEITVLLGIGWLVICCLAFG